MLLILYIHIERIQRQKAQLFQSLILAEFRPQEPEFHCLSGKIPTGNWYKSKFLRSEFYQKAVRSGILKNSTRNFAHKNSQLHLMISQIFIMCGLANILISGIVRYWGWHHSGTVVDKIAIFCFWIPVYCSSNITSYTSWWFCILTSFFEQHCFLFLDFWQAKCAYAFSISILPLPFLIVYTYDTWIRFFVFWKRK